MLCEVLIIVTTHLGVAILILLSLLMTVLTTYLRDTRVDKSKIWGEA